jgi:hypothetical protein
LSTNEDVLIKLKIEDPTQETIDTHVTTLALGSRSKQRACKVVGQERSPGIMSHVPESAKECEGMNPHTHKATPTLGDGVPNFQREILGVKTQWSEEFFISLESSWNVDV